MNESRPLWESPILRQVAGDTLRPGAFDLTNRAADMIGLLPGWRVLDVGCGFGATMNHLRARYGAQTFGIDMSLRQLTWANNKKGMVQASGQDLPFTSATFDAVFCECVFSLLPEKKAAADELIRALKPDGFLIISDLYTESPPASSGQSCASKAVPIPDTQACLEEAGFTTYFIEDYSPLLKQLAAKLILAGDPSMDNTCCRSGLGYYLLIAQKQGNSHAQ